MPHTVNSAYGLTSKMTSAGVELILQMDRVMWFGNGIWYQIINIDDF